MPIVINRQIVALKLVAALHAQGKVNDQTYTQIVKRYSSMQGGVHIGQRQSA